MSRPIIGITTNLGSKGAELAEGYWHSIERAGATPLLLVPTDDTATLISQVEQLDGLLLSGGGDINPILIGEEPIPELGGINPRRDTYELRLLDEALRRSLPVLGICRGMQVIALGCGGKVAQDMRVWWGAHPATSDGGAPLTLLKHSQDAPRDCATHHVSVLPDTMLAEAVQAPRFPVNSFHHQAVVDAGSLRVAATAADGCIEAIESRPSRSFIMGVQWHPECMADRHSQQIFRRFVEEAEYFCRALNLHASITTLDSHCDTPMTFEAALEAHDGDETMALDYTDKRHETDGKPYFVDAERMDIGHLDEVFMVSYIPQGQRTEEGYAAAKKMVEETYRRISIMESVTPRLRGRIHRGIENGYAMGTDLELIAHYKRMGCEYITLCHNGHNDLCDSAKPKADEPAAEHGGLSELGREAVREMNRLGMLIDVSHAAEKSVMDVLECSSRPIAVTHTCCRALRNHPRNLSDEVLKAVASQGGVVQCTMYEDFVALDHPEAYGIAPEDNASILTFMVHLEHLIRLCGIDHVGIGSDFDGDGGVAGLEDVSKAIDITVRLLKAGYSDDDICKIWGDNFRRVLYSC